MLLQQKRLFTIFGVLILCLSTNQLLAATTSTSLTPPAPIYLYPSGFCLIQTIQLCGVSFTVPNGYVGDTQNITLPEQFQIRSAALQCVVDYGGIIHYRLVDTSGAARCVLKPCGAGAVRVCNRDIVIDHETAVGDTVRLTIPAALLARNMLPPDLYARCDLVNNIPQYNVTNADSFSCNNFACQPTVLNACGSQVNIGGTVDLGTVINTETADHQPITVECIGTQANAPDYRVVDQRCN